MSDEICYSSQGQFWRVSDDHLQSTHKWQHFHVPYNISTTFHMSMCSSLECIFATMPPLNLKRRLHLKVVCGNAISTGIVCGSGRYGEGQFEHVSETISYSIHILGLYLILINVETFHMTVLCIILAENYRTFWKPFYNTHPSAHGT